MKFIIGLDELPDGRNCMTEPVEATPGALRLVMHSLNPKLPVLQEDMDSPEAMEGAARIIHAFGVASAAAGDVSLIGAKRH